MEADGSLPMAGNKIALVVTNLAGGGAEKAMVKIAQLLQARGNEAHLVLLEGGGDHRAPEEIPVHRVTPAGRSLSKGFVGKRLAAWRLKKLIGDLAQGRSFDLIVSTLPLADEVAILAGLPHHWCRIANTLSMEVRRLEESHPAKARRRLGRYRALYGQRPLVAVSAGVAHDLRDGLALSSPVETIPNPFDAELLRRQAAEPVSGLPTGPYVIHVGRFASQKRHDLLLDAWQRLDQPHHRLVLLTPPDPRLDALIRDRGLEGRVTVAGFQQNPYPWIAGADLLVLCSDHEGLPNVLLEALACGTPAVSTDCPSGPREILAAYPGCLVPCGDAAALADAISRNLAQPPDLALADLSPYSPATVAAAWEHLAREGKH